MFDVYIKHSSNPNLDAFDFWLRVNLIALSACELARVPPFQEQASCHGGAPTMDKLPRDWYLRVIWWYLGMDQYLLIPFLGGWTSINPSYFGVHQGYQGFDPSPFDWDQPWTISTQFHQPWCCRTIQQMPCSRRRVNTCNTCPWFHQHSWSLRYVVVFGGMCYNYRF